MRSLGLNVELASLKRLPDETPSAEAAE